jgi:hypothetical protein
MCGGFIFAGTIPVPPGQATARADIVDLRQGDEYHVRVGFPQPEMGSGEPASGFTIVPHDVGELQTMDVRPAEWKTMPHTMNLKPEVSTQVSEAAK